MNWILLILLASLWGSGFAVTKVAVSTMPPEWVMALRLAVAGIVLWSIVHLRGRRLPVNRAAWGWFTALAVIGNNVPFFLVSWGIMHIASGAAGILMATVPLVAVVLAHFVLPDERLSALKAAGFILGFAGAAMLIGPEHLFGIEARGMAFWGQVAVIGGAFCYAVTGLVGRRMPPQGVLETAAATSLAGGILGLVFAGFVSPTGLAATSTESFVAVVVLGLMQTALPALIYFRLLLDAGVGFVSYTNYLIPVVALGVGVIFLDETFRAAAILGLALILAGIAVSRSSIATKAAPQP